EHGQSPVLGCGIAPECCRGAGSGVQVACRRTRTRIVAEHAPFTWRIFRPRWDTVDPARDGSRISAIRHGKRTVPGGDRDELLLLPAPPLTPPRWSDIPSERSAR